MGASRVLKGCLGLFVIVLLTSACGGGSSTTTTRPTTTTAPTTTTTVFTTIAPPQTTTTLGESHTFAIVGVTFGSVNPIVVIRNVSATTLELGGHYIAKQPAYFLIPSVPVPPDGTVAISLGGQVFIAPESAIKVDQVAHLGSIDPQSGELGLYTSKDFASHDALVDYVEWGASGHTGSSTAIGAGVWPDGLFVKTTSDSIGMSAAVAPADDPENWTVVNG